jgi:hypothetical protein
MIRTSLAEPTILTEISLSRPMPGYYLKLCHSASFQILSTSLFTSRHTIHRYTFSVTDVSLSKQ